MWWTRCCEVVSKHDGPNKPQAFLQSGTQPALQTQPQSLPELQTFSSFAGSQQHKPPAGLLHSPAGSSASTGDAGGSWSEISSGQANYQVVDPADGARSGSFSSGSSRWQSNRSIEARDTCREPAADSSHADRCVNPDFNQGAVLMLAGLSSFRAFPDGRKSVQVMIAHLQKECMMASSQANWIPALDTIHSSPVSPRSPLTDSPSKEKNRPGNFLMSMSRKLTAKPGLRRASSQSSQGAFAEPSQTAVIFDWDDTLFPTSFLIHRCKLNGLARLQDQLLHPEMMAALAVSLSTLAAEVVALLRLAGTCGRVMLVTLARPPWVKISCMYFMPRVWEVIRELDVNVVYAQEGSHPKEPESLEAFRFARMKARAITKELEDFYSQYEGQSWKNVISIGDSNNERLGTMEATEVYLSRKQAEAASSGPQRSGLMAALSLVSGAALAEVSAALHIQKVYRGYAARQKFNFVFLPRLLQAKGRLRAAFFNSNSSDSNLSSFARVQDPQESQYTTTIPKCYSEHASLPTSSFHLPPAARVDETLHVRTKTVKMVAEPLMMELWVQLQLLKSWLPRIVKQDRSLDIDLNSFHASDVLQRTDDMLSAS
eukprot:TRINITY_DN59786_c0_g1_i1.p1 TRINITY_DN59786_c0_g1~~TRINITY_DN59786_c0_g1_i1.p1  ORF type:complete len:600 (+),score=96.60 TRINITY_DN59786_c0_g1_i1:86-1885(+)